MFRETRLQVKCSQHAHRENSNLMRSLKSNHWTGCIIGQGTGHTTCMTLNQLYPAGTQTWASHSTKSPSSIRQSSRPHGCLSSPKYGAPTTDHYQPRPRVLRALTAQYHYYTFDSYLYLQVLLTSSSECCFDTGVICIRHYLLLILMVSDIMMHTRGSTLHTGTY